jgi:hypothetical protein
VEDGKTYVLEVSVESPVEASVEASVETDQSNRWLEAWFWLVPSRRRRLVHARMWGCGCAMEWFVGDIVGFWWRGTRLGCGC